MFICIQPISHFGSRGNSWLTPAISWKKRNWLTPTIPWEKKRQFSRKLPVLVRNFETGVCSRWSKVYVPYLGLLWKAFSSTSVNLISSFLPDSLPTPPLWGVCVCVSVRETESTRHRCAYASMHKCQIWREKHRAFTICCILLPHSPLPGFMLF